MRGPAWLMTTARRYRDLDLEYAALRVVGRGLFLAVMLMVAFLYVFTRVTDLVAGTNEVLIPTVAVTSDVDLGALAQGAFSRTSASVVSVIGVVTLIASAMLTGHAIRRGSWRALRADQSPPIRLLSVRTIGVAVLLPVAILATWLLTLATSIRHSAWVTILGRDASTGVIDTGKVLAVVLSLVLIGSGVLLVVRFTLGHLPRTAFLAAIIVAVAVVVANFFLLYTYVGALINPDVSAGIVLVFTLLLWVNICVRVYLAALCWIGARS
jgi:hypothetical protein